MNSYSAQTKEVGRVWVRCFHVESATFLVTAAFRLSEHFESGFFRVAVDLLCAAMRRRSNFSARNAMD